MNFDLFHSPACTLIQGHLRLSSHNPHIDWPMGKIQGGGDCKGKCLRDKTLGKATTVKNTVSVQPLTESQYPDLTSVPTHYHHLKEVFNKVKAMSLPPHQS